MIRVILMCAAVCSVAAAAEQSGSPKAFYQERERGWYWREVPPTPEEKRTEEPGQQSPAAELSPREILKQQGEKWEDALASAVLKPTKENLSNYLENTVAITNQGMRFSDAFQHAIWQNPKYDYTLQRPVVGQAAIVANQTKVADDEFAIRSLANKVGLIYYFRSDCPYCARFSPVLLKFAEMFGFTVIPVSLDGKGTQYFPYPKADQQLGLKLRVENVPALFMVEPETDKVVPVGYGYIDWSQLTKRIVFSGSLLDDSKHKTEEVAGK